jgi:thiosulfate dehydrogenase (quinone) large subunit
MPMNPMEKALAVFFRVTMGWVFLYAAYQQISDPNWTAATFLDETRTAHDFFVWFASPTKVAATNFLVKWGHLSIGLSLVFGFLTRLSAFKGAILMFVYYLAHMDFPYVENQSNFLVDYHLIYLGVLVQLMISGAGHIVGLDRWVSRSHILHEHPFLRWLVGIQFSPGAGSR